MGRISGKRQLEQALHDTQQDDDIEERQERRPPPKIGVAPVRWLEKRIEFWDDDHAFKKACLSAPEGRAVRAARLRSESRAARKAKPRAGAMPTLAPSTKPADVPGSAAPGQNREFSSPDGDHTNPLSTSRLPGYLPVMKKCACCPKNRGSR
jgi:hypothetical protein